MKLNIKVVSKGGKNIGANVCPWVMDVPPENNGK